MNLSEPSDDESSSDESNVANKRRKTQDTYEASSTTSHGSVFQESDDDHQGGIDKKCSFNSKHTISNSKMLSQRSTEEDIRLSRSSMSDNRSSPYDRFSDKPGLSEHEADSGEEGYRPTFQNSIEETFTHTQTSFLIQGEYSDKAQKIMSNMGFRPGKGLGKFEHGRVEPVEASSHKGRRGLGLRPSTLGEVPRDFKWSPDEAKPEAKEVVLWLKPSSDEPLSGNTLEEWLLKGPKKLSIEDEINFVDEEILRGVLNAKNIFDTLDEEDLRHARFRSNPYETIGAVIFLNRAAVKMANLDAICDFMFTKPKKPNGESMLDRKDILYFADVCAGPGGFSEYILFRKGWRAKGFGFTLKGSNDFKLSDFYAGPPETFNTFYGAEDDGNVFNPANLSSLKDHVLSQTEDKGVHFLMADGGFSVEGQENLQEVLSKQLYLCQCLSALMLVRSGGHFIVKLFDIYTKFSVGLVYLMYRCFEQVSIHKPVTSRPANSERYLICRWKRTGTEAVERHLYSVNAYMWRERDRGPDVLELVPLSVIEEDRAFYDYVYSSNVVLGEKQIRSLMKLAEFSKNKGLKETTQAEMREQCLQLWQLPAQVRTQPERLGPEDTLKWILTGVKHRPPEAHSLPLFKSTVLGRPPTLLEGIMDLKVFRSVFDWHFTILSCGKGSPDLRFFIGCGGKQVYQLDGLRWMNAVDLHVTLPARTLLYGEIVKEYRGEGNTQVYSKALHVVDALALGGVDISALPLSERLSQCAQFCAALEKPFTPQAMPIRCKRLWNMEQFSMAADNLEYRAMKRIKRAVTVTIPNRSTRDEMFHIVGSVLFLKEIREPWEARISKRSGHKYYFGIGSDGQPRSEYFIPEEGRLDMLSAFASRVMWPWEPASAVLEGLAHEGLTRSEMEDYIERNSKQ